MTAIVCVSQSWGIGRDGALLFRISADHKRFRALTVGKTVILGHKTLDTFPGGKPLKDRRNIVLSHRDLDVSGAEIAHSFDEAAALGGDDAIVSGCASVYMARLSRCLAQNPPRAWGQALRQPQARRSSAPQSRRHQPQCLRLEARAPQYPPCQGIRLG